MTQDFRELRLERVSRRFANPGQVAITALDELTIAIPRGEFVALLGPSGCGKTTALNCVAGLLPLSGGSIWLDDRRIDVLPPEKRGFGMVFQNYALFPHMSVRRNVSFGLRMRGTAAAEIERRVTKAFALVQLEGHEEKLPGQLSGGQQQRVAIARAIVIEPPLLLMDEPLSNLDAKLREEARAWLRELIVRLHLSALVVTHDQTEAMAMADKILLLNAGRIEQQGTPEELYSRPQTQFTAEFMGSNNHLPGKVAQLVDGRAMLEGEGWRLWGMARGDLKQGDAATGIIRLERTQIANGASENRVRTELVTGMFLGDRRENLFKLGGLRLRCYGTTPASGECWLELPRDALWVFPAAA